MIDAMKRIQKQIAKADTYIEKNGVEVCILGDASEALPENMRKAVIGWAREESRLTESDKFAIGMAGYSKNGVSTVHPFIIARGYERSEQLEMTANMASDFADHSPEFEWLDSQLNEEEELDLMAAAF